MKLLKRLFQEEEGLALIEYALIAALISVVLIAMLNAVAGGIGEAFQSVVNALTGGAEIAPEE